MGTNVTLKEVAAIAGVSVATVARVIHKNGYVASETQKCVEAALEQTGYRMNVLAQGLRKQRSYIIGHILKSTFPNSFYVQVSLGVEQAALEHDYAALVYNIQGDAERERLGVEMFIRRRVDAILFTTPTDLANVRLAQNAGIPVVQVERPLTLDASRVVVDNYRGAAAAMDHLIGLGHRCIAFIGQDPASEANLYYRYVEEQRLAAYIDRLNAHGISVGEGLIAFGSHYHYDPRSYSGDGRRLTDRLLHMIPRPTAIFATSDMLATGTLQSIHTCGLRVPNDISVVGFDDTYASLLTPALTTVRLPMLEMGQAAVRMIVSILESDPRDRTAALTETLGTELVIRESTAPVPVA